MSPEPTPTRRHGRVVRLVALFVALFFLGDRVGAWVLERVVSLSHDRYVALYEGRGAADLVVIGNSRADVHFPPRLMTEMLGRPVVNYGLGGISMRLSEALFMDHVERNGPPKVLLIEADMLRVSAENVGDMRLFVPRSERLAEILEEFRPTFYYAAKIFHLFNYNNEMFFRTLFRIVRPDEDRGFDHTMTPALFEAVGNRRPYSLENDPRNEEAMRQLIKFARERGIRVSIVTTPVLGLQRSKIENLDTWLERVRSIAGNEDGVEVFDTLDFLSDREFFRDAVHMNRRGSLLLFQELKDRGAF